jgi:hypothetical protein
LVDDVAEPLEEGTNLLALRAGGGEVDIGEVARHLIEEVQVRGTVQAVGEGAEDAQLESSLLRFLDDVQRAVDVLEIGDGHEL